MSLATSLSDHLINFGPSVDTSKPFGLGEDAVSSETELELARVQIAELQQALETAGDLARAEAQAEIDALVKAKDDELQVGMDELRATYETKVGQLAETLQTQIAQHNKELSERLAAWCLPVLRSLSTQQCMEDLAAVAEALLNDKCELTIEGPDHLLTLLEPHLADLPGPTWTMTKTEGPEVVITSDEARIETCLDEWLRSVEGEAA